MTAIVEAPVLLILFVPFKQGIKEQIITNIPGAVVIHAKPTEIEREKVWSKFVRY